MKKPRIVWCAAFEDRVKHAFRVVGIPYLRSGKWRHVPVFNQQVCKPNVSLGSPEHWLAIRTQPRKKCKKCKRRLK